MLDSAETFTVYAVDSTKIVARRLDGAIQTWSADGSNVQPAIDWLNGPGDVWIPKDTALSLPHLKIRYSGTGLHGWGEGSVLNFTDSSYGIRAAQNPDLPPNSQFQWGISDITLDNFKFTNGAMFLTIRNNLTMKNIVGEDIHTMTAAIRLICPYGVDTNGDGVTDSPDAKTENVWIENVHINRSASHGFQLNSTTLRGCIFDTVTFQDCSSMYGGCYLWDLTQHGKWSVGFDLAEAYSMPAGTATVLTVKNIIVNNCVAQYAFESGYHFENSPAKENILFLNCEGSYNGQKFLTTDPQNTGGCGSINNQADCQAVPGDGCCWYPTGGCYYWGNGTNYGLYGSGFFGLSSAMTLINCTANGNGYLGFYCRGTSDSPIMSGCSGDIYNAVTNPTGNGCGCIPHGPPWSTYAGKCRNCATCP